MNALGTSLRVFSLVARLKLDINILREILYQKLKYYFELVRFFRPCQLIFGKLCKCELLLNNQ